MTNKKSLLVALDTSEQSRMTVEYLSRFIPSRNMSITLFHLLAKAPHTFWDSEPFTVDWAMDMKNGYWVDHEKKHAHEFLEQRGRKFIDAGLAPEDLQIQTDDRHKGLASDLLAKARQDFDAVVVGRTGHSRVGELVMGSVAQRLVNHLEHLPLCLVDGSPEATKILVALDASESSAGLVNFLSPLLTGGDHEITLFHAVRHLDLPGYVADMPNVQEADRNLIEESGKLMEPILSETKNRLVKEGVDDGKVTIRIAKGVLSRSNAIIEEADRKNIGSIFIGRRGISRMDEFFMGRVSRKVIQMARNKAVWIVG